MVGERSNAEICDLDVSEGVATAYEDVAWLDISMSYASRM
jgi:hypothetical protein